MWALLLSNVHPTWRGRRGGRLFAFPLRPRGVPVKGRRFTLLAWTLLFLLIFLFLLLFGLFLWALFLLAYCEGCFVFITRGLFAVSHTKNGSFLLICSGFTGIRACFSYWFCTGLVTKSILFSFSNFFYNSLIVKRIVPCSRINVKKSAF